MPLAPIGVVSFSRFLDNSGHLVMEQHAGRVSEDPTSGLAALVLDNDEGFVVENGGGHVQVHLPSLPIEAALT